MVVIKRDGREADFDKGKIANAILKAFTEVEKLSAVGDKNEVPKKISTRLYNRYQRRNRAISVEEIQDDVETELMKEGEFVVAKAYIKYRFCGTLLLWTAKSSLLRITSMKQSSRRIATKIPQSSLLRETTSPAR